MSLSLLSLAAILASVAQAQILNNGQDYVPVTTVENSEAAMSNGWYSGCNYFGAPTMTATGSGIASASVNGFFGTVPTTATTNHISAFDNGYYGRDAVYTSVEANGLFSQYPISQPTVNPDTARINGYDFFVRSRAAALDNGEVDRDWCEYEPECSSSDDRYDSSSCHPNRPPCALRLSDTSYECPESSYTSSESGCEPIPPCPASADSDVPCPYGTSSSSGWGGWKGRRSAKKPAASARQLTARKPMHKRPMARDQSETSEVVQWPNAFGFAASSSFDEVSDSTTVDRRRRRPAFHKRRLYQDTVTSEDDDFSQDYTTEEQTEGLPRINMKNIYANDDAKIQEGYGHPVMVNLYSESSSDSSSSSSDNHRRRQHRRHHHHDHHGCHPTPAPCPTPMPTPVPLPAEHHHHKEPCSMSMSSESSWSSDSCSSSSSSSSDSCSSSSSWSSSDESCSSSSSSSSSEECKPRRHHHHRKPCHGPCHREHHNCHNPCPCGQVLVPIKTTSMVPTTITFPGQCGRMFTITTSYPVCISTAVCTTIPPRPTHHHNQCHIPPAPVCHQAQHTVTQCVPCQQVCPTVQPTVTVTPYVSCSTIVSCTTITPGQSGSATGTASGSGSGSSGSGSTGTGSGSGSGSVSSTTTVVTLSTATKSVTIATSSTGTAKNAAAVAEPASKLFWTAILGAAIVMVL